MLATRTHAPHSRLLCTETARVDDTLANVGSKIDSLLLDMETGTRSSPVWSVSDRNAQVGTLPSTRGTAAPRESQQLDKFQVAVAVECLTGPGACSSQGTVKQLGYCCSETLRVFRLRPTLARTTQRPAKTAVDARGSRLDVAPSEKAAPGRDASTSGTI